MKRICSFLKVSLIGCVCVLPYSCLSNSSEMMDKFDVMSLIRIDDVIPVPPVIGIPTDDPEVVGRPEPQKFDRPIASTYRWMPYVRIP